MEIDEPIASGSNETQERFGQRVTNAEQSFLKFADHKPFLRKVNLEILRKMCRDRGLTFTNKEKKAELYSLLTVWVSFVFNM